MRFWVRVGLNMYALIFISVLYLHIKVWLVTNHFSSEKIETWAVWAILLQDWYKSTFFSISYLIYCFLRMVALQLIKVTWKYYWCQTQPFVVGEIILKYWSDVLCCWFHKKQREKKGFRRGKWLVRTLYCRSFLCA